MTDERRKNAEDGDPSSKLRQRSQTLASEFVLKDFVGVPPRRSECFISTAGKDIGGRGFPEHVLTRRSGPSWSNGHMYSIRSCWRGLGLLTAEGFSQYSWPQKTNREGSRVKLLFKGILSTHLEKRRSSHFSSSGTLDRSGQRTLRWSSKVDSYKVKEGPDSRLSLHFVLRLDNRGGRIGRHDYSIKINRRRPCQITTRLGLTW